MKVEVGRELGFPAQILCRCGGRAGLVFGITETDDGMPKVKDLGRGDLWPHAFVAVALYVCGRCGEPRATMTEAPRENGDGEALDPRRDQAQGRVHEESEGEGNDAGADAGQGSGEPR